MERSLVERNICYVIVETSATLNCGTIETFNNIISVYEDIDDAIDKLKTFGDIEGVDNSKLEYNTIACVGALNCSELSEDEWIRSYRLEVVDFVKVRV